MLTSTYMRIIRVYIGATHVSGCYYIVLCTVWENIVQVFIEFRIRIRRDTANFQCTMNEYSIVPLIFKLTNREINFVFRVRFHLV
jgi:hypothetical protein